METTKDGNAPATKEDIRHLEATLIACAQVCTIMIGQTLERKTLPLDQNKELREIMRQLIEKFRDDLLTRNSPS